MAFNNLTRLVRERGECRIAAVGAAAEEVLQTTRRVYDEGLAIPVLVGQEDRIRSIADKCRVNV